MKVLSLNSVSVLVRLVCGFVTIKLIAIFLSPSGMALLGNFRNFTSGIKSISTLGFETGIVKYVTENKNKPKIFNKLIATVLISILIVCILVMILICSFSTLISLYVFNEPIYALEIKIFGILFPLYSIHIVLISILHGLKEFKNYIIIAIISSFINLSITIFLIYFLQLRGAILSLAILESTFVFFSIFFVLKSLKIDFKFEFRNFSPSLLNKLLSYSTMALTTAILSQLTLLYIRQNLIENFGGTEAGYWETISRISFQYLIFISSGISLYYLPKLTEQTNDKGFKIQVVKYFKVMLPLCLLMFIPIYVLKEQIILILLNKEYLPVTELFSLQLLGDFIKICTFAFSFQLLAKRMLKEYLITEILFYLIYFTLSIKLIPSYGAKGIIMAYTASYSVYLLSILYVFKNIFFTKNI